MGDRFPSFAVCGGGRGDGNVGGGSGRGGCTSEEFAGNRSPSTDRSFAAGCTEATAEEEEDDGMRVLPLLLFNMGVFGGEVASW